MANDKKKIAKKDLARLLTEWGRQFALFTPSRAGDTAKMARWDGKDTSFLNWYRNTTIPAKNCFLPAVEEMFTFSRGSSGYNLKPTPAEEPGRLIFGIRPCDAKALRVLDNVFEDSYEDPYYLGRRRNTILVGLGCNNPYDSCFCTSLDSDPHDDAGLDIMLTDIGDELLIQAISEAGKKLIIKTGSLTKAGRADAARARKAREAARNKVSRRLNTSNIEKRLLDIFDDQGYWQQLARKCISCGICTLLCPTCHCFDINDEMSGGQGARCRNLDSCAFPIYTKMPMENPRAEKWRRVRNKVCHKYEFYPMLFDMIACTGCGRCIRLCPVNWDITQVIEGVPAAASG